LTCQAILPLPSYLVIVAIFPTFLDLSVQNVESGNNDSV
jgi:hypothetical protein